MTTSAPMEIAAWLGCLAFLVALANGLVKLKGTVLGEKQLAEVSPQPLEVRMAEDFVRKHECEMKNRQIQDRIGALEREFREMREDRRREIGALHEKVNGVAREVSELSASSLLHMQRLAAIEAKLDRVIERHNHG